MSLKGFHVVFIAVSVALAVGFAWWGWERYMAGGEPGFLGAALGSLAVAAALVVYELWFVRRMKEVES